MKRTIPVLMSALCLLLFQCMEKEKEIKEVVTQTQTHAPEPTVHQTLPNKKLKETLKNASCDTLVSGLFESTRVEESGGKDAVLSYITEMKSRGCCPGSENEEYMFDAHESRSYEKIKFLLECGFESFHPFEVMGEILYYYLEYASEENTDIVEYFIENGHTDEKRRTVGLIIAARNGRNAIVRCMLESGVNVMSGYTNTWGNYTIVNPGDYYFFPITEIENGTALYTSVSCDHLDTAQLLIDFGADINAVRREYDVKIVHKITQEVVDDENRLWNGELDVNDYEYKRFLTKEESVIDVAMKKGYKDFIEKTKAYISGNQLSTEDIAFLRKTWNAGEFELLAEYVRKIEDKPYCIRDRDLLRNTAFWAATGLFIKEDFDNAIPLFRKAIQYAASNSKGVGSLSELQGSDVSQWEHEGEGNAPCYYCAYNIACACSRLEKIREGFDWLALAFQMNPGLKKSAKTDRDLENLREQKDEFEKLIR